MSQYVGGFISLLVFLILIKFHGAMHVKKWKTQIGDLKLIQYIKAITLRCASTNKDTIIWASSPCGDFLL